MKQHRDLKKISLSGLLLIISAVLLCILLFFILPAWKSAAETGKELGTSAGKKVGQFSGSLRGTADGISESQDYIMSTEEICEKLRETLTDTHSLEVLSAGTDISRTSRDGASYKSLYILRGTAVFKVNMDRASVSSYGNNIFVTLPQPEAEIFIDENQTAKLADESGIIFSGSSDDGYKPYQDADAVSEMPALTEKAREQARIFTERIAASVCGDKAGWTVKFENETGGEINE